MNRFVQGLKHPVKGFALTMTLGGCCATCCMEYTNATHELVETSQRGAMGCNGLKRTRGSEQTSEADRMAVRFLPGMPWFEH